MKKLLKGVIHLKRVQDTQLEFLLLKYCVCSVPMHLCRMLEPHTVAMALHAHEFIVKAQLERITADAGQQIELSKDEWDWAKLPVRKGGRRPGAQ